MKEKRFCPNCFDDDIFKLIDDSQGEIWMCAKCKEIFYITDASTQTNFKIKKPLNEQNNEEESSVSKKS